jgi:valyl-tRNA synthetase
VAPRRKFVLYFLVKDFLFRRDIMKRELNNKYNHLEVEEGKYNTWVEKGYFTSGDKEKEPFSIVIPPPNVTGKLHLGHAWDTTLQDII